MSTAFGFVSVRMEDVTGVGGYPDVLSAPQHFLAFLIVTLLANEMIVEVMSALHLIRGKKQCHLWIT